MAMFDLYVEFHVGAKTADKVDRGGNFISLLFWCETLIRRYTAVGMAEGRSRISTV